MSTKGFNKYKKASVYNNCEENKRFKGTDEFKRQQKYIKKMLKEIKK